MALFQYSIYCSFLDIVKNEIDCKNQINLLLEVCERNKYKYIFLTHALIVPVLWRICVAGAIDLREK